MSETETKKETKEQKQSQTLATKEEIKKSSSNLPPATTVELRPLVV